MCKLRPLDASTLAKLCRRSCSRIFVMPAVAHTLAQVRLTSVSGPEVGGVAPLRGLLVFALGKTYGQSPTASFFISAISACAGAESGTRCTLFCFVCADGLVQTPAARSNWPQSSWHFAAPRASQHQEPDRIRRSLLRMRGECLCKSPYLSGRQETLPLFLVCPLDPAGRVILAPSLFDRQAHHRGQHGDSRLARYGARLAISRCSDAISA